MDRKKRPIRIVKRTLRLVKIPSIDANLNGDGGVRSITATVESKLEVARSEASAVPTDPTNFQVDMLE